MTVTHNKTKNRVNILADIADRYLGESKNILVTFTKKDGTERKMYCTRNMNVIPSDKHPKGTDKSRADHLIVAFDIEKGEWRSFNEESVLVVQHGSMIHEAGK